MKQTSGFGRLAYCGLLTVQTIWASGGYGRDIQNKDFELRKWD